MFYFPRQWTRHSETICMALYLIFVDKPLCLLLFMQLAIISKNISGALNLDIKLPEVQKADRCVK